MTEPSLYVLGQPSNAHTYHTTDDPAQCRKIQQSLNDPRPASESLVEWHDLPECQYCSGEYEPWSKGAVVANE